MENSKIYNNHELIIDFSTITFGSLLMALAVNLFIKEHSLAPGGITGFSVIMNKVLKIPIDFIYLGISIPLLLLGIKFLGKTFGIKTLYITCMCPLFIRIIPQVHVTNNFLVASIAGGFLVGLGIGISLLKGATTGGTDLAASLLNKFIPSIKIPIFLFILDGSVVISSGIVSHDYKTAIYSMISLLIIIKTIDLMLKIFKVQ